MRGVRRQLTQERLQSPSQRFERRRKVRRQLGPLAAEARFGRVEQKTAIALHEIQVALVSPR